MQSDLLILDPGEKNTCVARLPDGMAVFVAGPVVPGDRVRIEIIERRKKFARAKMIEITEPAPDRVDAPCPVFGTCGGCKWQQLGSVAQARIKQKQVQDALERIGRLENPPVEEIISGDQQYLYRNAVRLRLLHSEKGLQPAMQAANSHEPVPIGSCLLASSDINRVLIQVMEVLNALPEERQTLCRSLLLRKGREDSLGAVIGVEENAQLLCDALRGVSWPKGLRVSIARPEGPLMNLAGEGWIEEELAGVVLRQRLDAFLQVNHEMAERMVEIVLEMAAPHRGKAVDLFAGCGTFSLPLAKAGFSVTAIEGFPEAAETLRANAERNGVTIKARCEDLRQKVVLPKRPALLVMDPPRNGVHGPCLKAVIFSKPARLIYVSCNPATFARDAKTLSEAGFVLERVVPLDLFPQTAHVELIAQWRS